MCARQPRGSVLRLPPCCWSPTVSPRCPPAHKPTGRTAAVFHQDRRKHIPPDHENGPPRICVETRPIHCASSTRQCKGVPSEASDSRLSSSSPTRKRSGGVPSRVPEHRLQRFALRLGEVQQRQAELVRGGVGQLHLGLDTGGAHRSHAGRRALGVLQQRRLPDPGTPCTTSPRLSPCADARDHLIEDGALSARAVRRCQRAPGSRVC
jgi:hypothetical protein